MKPVLMILIVILTSFNLIGQDSTQILTVESYIEIVKNHHPYAYRAELIRKSADAGLLEAKGSFDPILFGNMDQKYFQNSKYFSHIQGGIKIPTWFGISLETGYEQNEGVYLNPEFRVPENGLWYAGIRLELGNGLIIDERRATMQKAKIYQSASEQERIIMLNKLIKDAKLAYYDWQQAFYQTEVYRLGYENALERLEAVKGAVIFGDRSPIDTVEALITVENRRIKLIQSEMYLESAINNLEIYLWSDGFVPLELVDVIPEELGSFGNEIIRFDLEELAQTHPFIQMNNLKIDQQEVDLNFKKEQLKPKLTFKYNAINEPLSSNVLSGYNPSNYKWGASFSYPILSRKERGAVALADLKVLDQQLYGNVQMVELKNSILNAKNNYEQIKNQLISVERLLESSARLFDAEKALFNLGESSIFMINTRENQWLNSQIQFIESNYQGKKLETELMFVLMMLN